MATRVTLDRAEILRYLATAHHFTVMGVDYRGYGKSDGQPNEEGLYQDGRRRNWQKSQTLKQKISRF